MGTPEFALAPLQALVKSGYHVIAVYTQPPRPKGRGHTTTPSPVHQFALREKIPVFTPLSLNAPDAIEHFQQLGADLAIVAAYGLLLPKDILAAPRLGCINIHASLLPRWRGAAPIHRAIEAGDSETGITIMQMDEGLDTGPMLYHQKIVIASGETSQSLHARMLELGTQSLLACLPNVLSKQIIPVPQPNIGVTYAHKLKKAESNLDFTQSAVNVINKIRALAFWPGTSCNLDGETIKIIEAEFTTDSFPYAPGTWIVINNANLLICCKTGAISLRMLQRPGANPISSIDFLNGYRGSSIIFIK